MGLAHGVSRMTGPLTKNVTDVVVLFKGTSETSETFLIWVPKNQNCVIVKLQN